MSGQSGNRINIEHSRFCDESLLTNCNFYNINPLLNYDIRLESDRRNQESGEIRNRSQDVRDNRYNNNAEDEGENELNQLYQTCNNLGYSCSSKSLCSKYLNDPNNVTERALRQTDLSKPKYNYEPRVRFGKNCIPMPSKKLPEGGNETTCSDKTTFCRPLVDQYNQQFLYKTMETNARLQKLVKELVMVRQKERQTDNWENYIAELRKKHGYDDGMEPRTATSPEGLITPETIENYYNTKFTWKRSHPCQNLLQDVYEDRDILISQPRSHNTPKIPHEYHQTAKKINPYERNPVCYPTSSQGRLIVLERERKRQLEQRTYKPVIKTIYEDDTIRGTNTISRSCDDRTSNCKTNKKHKNTIVINSRGTNTDKDDSSVQTDIHNLTKTNRYVIKKKRFDERYHKAYVCSDESLKIEGLQGNDYNLKQSSIASIEQKLDGLINSINNFIVEMKSIKCSKRASKSHVAPSKKKENLNFTKSDSYGIGKNERFLCGLVHESGSTILTSGSHSQKSRHNDEVYKLNKFVQELRNNKAIIMKDSSVGEANHACSVEITFDIPTKDISTEVTRSLSKAEYVQGKASGDKNVVIEEIDPPRMEDRSMAIAVNTDPVSVLALLRVSTEYTIRKLLSYMPNIDYYHYLSMIPMSQLKPIDSQYICKICGAAFVKPSELSDHILKHELGKTRDCCVCRHVLDMVRRSPGLFKCQYCGMRFTRAYCCELHQQTCATRMGKKHDISSSLMLLK